jgi:RES domain-containing protein
MPRVWRIVKARHAGGAFDGEGARRTGGRWNGKGVAMIYTSGTASLALLEILVNVGTSSLLPAYSLASAEVDETLIEGLGEEALPADWGSSPPPAALQTLGDEWVASARSAALAVPSVVVPWETNLLLNPAHPRFAEIELAPPRRFELDDRLRTRR